MRNFLHRFGFHFWEFRGNNIYQCKCCSAALERIRAVL